MDNATSVEKLNEKVKEVWIYISNNNLEHQSIFYGIHVSDDNPSRANHNILEVLSDYN